MDREHKIPFRSIIMNIKAKYRPRLKRLENFYSAQIFVYVVFKTNW